MAIPFATAFDVLASGTTTLVFAERPVDVVQVWKGVVSCSGLATFSFEDTSGATLYHRITAAGLIWDEGHDPWISTSNGLGIRLVLDTAGVRVSGRFWYSR